MTPVRNSYKWADANARKLLKIEFIRFGIVGAIGFTISEIAIFIVYGKLALPYLAAFLIANESGLISNFILHENWTYKHVDHKHRSLMQKIVRFHLSSWSGVAIIIGVGVLAKELLHVNPYIGQALGSAVGMFWNFFWTKYYIFKGHSPAPLLNPEDVVTDIKSTSNE